ncbi:hypothetical protein V495_08388 [Pseudogymnoascus sp. VKM F-4514 (FW-929)]|nr:hypothetical protein V495_08388 [Pseudogymnoascus sp. VKM F-4514 (FW-929)]KFY62725.1 hypothetical protein V497_02248 [Pseudogymnoascus sp. VKM F-4516 (FW-969)]
MSDIPSYQEKALGTRILRSQGLRRVPSRRYRRADGVESGYSPTPHNPAEFDNTAITDASTDKIAANDGALSHPFGDLNQHGRTFKLPRLEITDKSPNHSPRRESEKLADLNPTLAGYSHQREIDLHDSKVIEGDTSLVISAPNLDQQIDEKFLYEPEVSNPVDGANSEGPDNADEDKTAVDAADPVSSTRRYKRSWPRPRYESGSQRSGYIPPSIAERISAQDEPVTPTNMKVLARLRLPSPLSQSSVASMAEVQAGRTSSPSIPSHAGERILDQPTPLRPHVSPNPAVYGHRQASPRPPTMHEGDLPARPAPAALPNIPMSGHNLNLESDHIPLAARDSAIPAIAHVRNTTTDRESAFRHNLVAPRVGDDVINTSHLQERQPYPIAVSYDGLGAMHSYNTETPVEPSTLESIYEDASDELVSTTPREERTVERSYQKTSPSSFIESARKASEYLRRSPPALEPSVVSSGLQHSEATKSEGHEPKVHESRNLHTSKSHPISKSEGIATNVSTLEQQAVPKRGALPYRRSLPVISASSSIYSQSESPSTMSDIRAAFIRGKEDTHRYERLGYQHDDSTRTVSPRQNVQGANQEGSGQLAQSPESKSRLELTHSKRPISQYTALFARRPSRKSGAMEHTRSGSTEKARQRKVPPKSSQLERFSHRFRPGRSNNSLKNSISAEELLTLKEAASEEYETNSSATDKQMSTISQKKTRGPKNWFEGVLSFHKNGTDSSQSLFINRKSDFRLNKEVIRSGFIPYDKHTGHSGPIRKKDTEDTEMLIMMIENLERRLDEALYPAYKVPGAAVVYVPQQQITGRVEARTRHSPIRRTSRYIQQDGSEENVGVEKNDLRSRFEKVSYGCDRNGAMRHEPLPAASSLRSNNVDNTSVSMSGALPYTDDEPLSGRGASRLESREPGRAGVSDLLSDNVTTNTPGNARNSAEVSGAVRMKSTDPAYYCPPSRSRPLRKSPNKTVFPAKARRRAVAIPRARQRELSKERILRFVKAYNFPPIQPRRSSRGIRSPPRDSSQTSDELPTSRHSERALRAHTSMDGAHEADDEMESETEYITPRRKRNRANTRRHRISYEEAHQMHFLHGERESSGQIFEWPPHVPQAAIRHDRGSSQSSTGTQRIYVTARSRQNRGAADMSPADERLVTVAAGFSVAFIMLLLCMYIVFGPENRYSMAI